jgi:hypothetical protein
MVVVTRCDRCGYEITNRDENEGEWVGKCVVSFDSEPDDPLELDLCDTCGNNFLKWLQWIMRLLNKQPKEDLWGMKKVKPPCNSTTTDPNTTEPDSDPKSTD